MVIANGADQQPTPHRVTQPDASGDEKQGTFRAVAIRYQSSSCRHPR